MRDGLQALPQGKLAGDLEVGKATSARSIHALTADPIRIEPLSLRSNELGYLGQIIM